MDVHFTPGWELKVMLAASDVTEGVAQAIADDIRGNIRTGGHVETGALLRSVRKRSTGGGSARVSIGTDHWQHIEYGTEAHEIIAPPGRVLVFTKESGEVVFTTRIRHPGNEPYMIVRRALYKKRGLTRHG